MEQDDAEDVETVLAQHMVRVFQVHHLTGPRAKRLLEKVRVLIDVGERRSLLRSTETPPLAEPDLLCAPTLNEKAAPLDDDAMRHKRKKGLRIHTKARA